MKEWVGKATSPPSAEVCRSLLESLLGEGLPATTFGIEYKCHDGGTNQSRETKAYGRSQWIPIASRMFYRMFYRIGRSQWIKYFADFVPTKHSVDLKAPARRHPP